MDERLEVGAPPTGVVPEGVDGDAPARTLPELAAGIAALKAAKAARQAGCQASRGCRYREVPEVAKGQPLLLQLS
jgi:hypothetical protein